MKKQIKVAYFPSDTSKDKVLGSNGKSLDRYCIKCESEEDLSTGNYICDLTFLIDDNIQDLLQEEVILKVLLDYGNEIFRISKVTVGTRYIDVVARQITISDSLTLWVEDVRPTNLNGQAAVTWMLDKSEGKKEIRIISDIDTIATAYYQRMSLYKALHDNDNSFLNSWGGEVQRRAYDIYINKRIGIDRGFTIREGKNLTGFECSSNIDNLVTRARGQGYNGILGNYIDSPLIGSYNRTYTSVIKYDDVKVKDEYSEEGYDTLEQAQSELDRRISEEFSKNDIDKIKASYIINFVQLEKTEEYKNYIVAERLFIGDDCRVYIPKLNVDIKVRALSKKYDVLAQKTKEIKLSNYIEAKPLSLKQIAEKLEKIDSTETILQLAKDNATALIKGGLKNSYVIVRENEIIIGDTKDINTMSKVWRWNNGGLGFSNTGYYGQYGTAITQDGAIVADFITTGQLNAALIKTGTIMSANGNLAINIDDEYLQVTHAEGSTKTRIDEEGFYILDENNETIASLASKESWSELKADKVFAKNIDNIYLGDSNLYVDHNSTNTVRDGTIDYPFTCFDELMSYLNRTQIINKNLTINVVTNGVAIDRLSLNGFRGNGYIQINLNKDFVLQGDDTISSQGIYIAHCDKVIVIEGGRTSYNSNDGARINNCNVGVECYYNKKVNVSNININAKSWGCYFYATNFYTRRLDLCSSPNGILSDHGSVGFDADSCGNCTNAYYVRNGGILCYGEKGSGGYAPMGSRYEHSGKLFEINARTSTGSYREAPVIPPTNNYNKSFGYSSVATYQYAWSNWKSGECKSGVYGGYGDKAGHIFFNLSDIRNFLNGGTVLDGATITLTRSNSGGSSGEVSIYVGGSSCSSASGTPTYYNKTYVGTLAWGETKTFTLPKSIVDGIKNGTINSITTHGSGYSNIVSASINLKVNK